MLHRSMYSFSFDCVLESRKHGNRKRRYLHPFDSMRRELPAAAEPLGFARGVRAKEIGALAEGSDAAVERGTELLDERAGEDGRSAKEE